MQRGASWYKSERKTGHSHSSVPVKLEALILPTHLEGFLGFPHPGRDQTDRKAEPLQEGFHSQDIHCSVVSILNFLIILSLDFCFCVNSEDNRAYAGNSRQISLLPRRSWAQASYPGNNAWLGQLWYRCWDCQEYRFYFTWWISLGCL